MSDVFTKEKRSEVMSRIKGKGNKDTELAMIQVLRKNHISGWRRNQAVLGKPDFVFPNQKIALFVDGCFWHGCPLPKHSNMPKNNTEFWAKKLQANKDRDRFVNRELRKAGWNVVRVWEHELKSPLKIVAKLNKHFQKLNVNTQPTINEFNSLIKQTHAQAKNSGLKKADIKSAVAKARKRSAG